MTGSPPQTQFPQFPEFPEFIDREHLCLNRNGVWLTDGEEITHERTCFMFFRSLKKDDKGWLIQIGHETKYIEIEDTAFFVLKLDGSSELGFVLTLSDGTLEKLAPESLSYQPERMTCKLAERPQCGGVVEAKFLAAPYYELLKHLEHDQKGYFLMIQGKRISLS